MDTWVTFSSNTCFKTTATLSGTATICSGKATDLTINFTGTSPWSGILFDGTNSAPINSINQSMTISESTAGTYTITSVSDKNCSGTSSGSAVITVNSLPTITSAVSPSANVCAGTSVTLTGSGAGNGGSYVWIGGNVVQQPNSFVPPSGSITYTVTGTDANNCSNKTTIAVNVNALPTVGSTASPSATLCIGTDVTLTATGTATGYTWTGGTSAITNGQPFKPASDVTYTVIAVNAVTTCSNWSSRAIKVNQLPTVGATATPSSSVCSGSTVTLSGTGTATQFVWSGGAGGVVNGTPFTPSGDATYTVIGTDQATNCSNSATQDIVLTSCNTIPPTPTITRPTAILLASSSATGNQWYYNGVAIPGAVYQTLAISQTTKTGDYTVVVTVNGIPSDPSLPYTLTNTTGVDEINNDYFFNVYPNPNEGDFNVSFDVSERGAYKLIVKNIVGQSVYQETLNNFIGVYLKQLNIAEFGNGVYMISLSGPKNEMIQKIIVY